MDVLYSANAEKVNAVDAVKANKGKKRKSKNKDCKTDSTDSYMQPGCNISTSDLCKAMDLLLLLPNPAKTALSVDTKHIFWDTQPVPKMSETTESNESIQENRVDIRADAYSLQASFSWDTLNLDDPLVLENLQLFLKTNYVEDNDAVFRFNYPLHFLKWAMQPPGWRQDWHVGVRADKSGRLVAFISAIPATLRVYSHSQKMVEINFLCVLKKLRSKRMTPVLIREITRRVNLTGIFQAVYKAHVVLPKPVGTCNYWHRPLNTGALLKANFIPSIKGSTEKKMKKLYTLPNKTKTPGFRKMVQADVPRAHKLLNEYLMRFDLAPNFTMEEFSHWFVPQTGIVDSFVVDNGTEVTDFVSYFTVPLTVIDSSLDQNELKTANSFYNVSKGTPWINLMEDALVTANNNGFDVFNALDMMENREFLIPLKFVIGDGKVHSYLFNWRCPAVEPKKNGLVLL